MVQLIIWISPFCCYACLCCVKDELRENLHELKNLMQLFKNVGSCIGILCLRSKGKVFKSQYIMKDFLDLGARHGMLLTWRLTCVTKQASRFLQSTVIYAAV